MAELASADYARMEQHASPEAVEAMLVKARRKVADAQRHVGKLEALQATRAAHVAAGEWPPKPDCEWFAWIGQSFRNCDRCGRPAWEHTGEETFPNAHDPFSDSEPVGRLWEPGEADRIRAKWESADA